ncbi:MAG: bacteriohemerythrin [Terracidiphilus sp.]|jgi:hemerythrin-like metal-binding protein
MAFFVWSDNLSVGVKASDDDHKKLIDILNRLYDGMKSGQGRDVVGKVLDDLISYTKFHFSREEELFTKTGYPAVEHKEEHRLLVKQVEDLRLRFKSGENSISVETLDFLKDWLTIHIQGTDKKYSGHLNAAGIR